jgi:hypothetical protein
MTKHLALLSAILASVVLVPQRAKAQVPVDVTLGTAGGNFTVGSTVTSGAFNTKVGPSGLNQPAPFNAFCGSDISTNCSASWMFTYAVPAGDEITSATLTLGILDIDSAAPGDQIASFTLDGTDDLTSLLNASSEGLNSGAGSPNSQYNILTITIPTADLAALDTGPATFTLVLQGPGLGVLATSNPPDNGAGLDFSTLDMEAEPGVGPPPPTPEPPTWMLGLTGLLAIGIKFSWKKVS